jgi:branched-subunit amino acid aminotransferase/4-amino-4-deoxychorismate lyase
MKRAVRAQAASAGVASSPPIAPTPAVEPRPTRVPARLIFRPGEGLRDGKHVTQPAPLVADSWLVADGAALAIEQHERRFRESCRALLPQLDEQVLDGFLGETRAALPREGLWFPRLEAYASPETRLVLWLREAPELEQDTRLWVTAQPDPRRLPRIKGPDLPALAKLRERARSSGADDALLIGRDGAALEAAHAAIVWWRRNTLCMPVAESSLLPSVTRSVVLELARRRGIGLIRERMLPRELPALETWTLNSLHGIRPVTAWHGGPVPQTGAVSRERVDDWSAALAELMVPIDGVGA